MRDGLVEGAASPIYIYVVLRVERTRAEGFDSSRILVRIVCVCVWIVHIHNNYNYTRQNNDRCQLCMQIIIRNMHLCKCIRVSA